jgi:hypothetical protein
MSPGYGILIGIIYLVLFFVFAVLSFRKGHWVLGLIGFVFPILWLVGALLPPAHGRRLSRAFVELARSRYAQAEFHPDLVGILVVEPGENI